MEDFESYSKGKTASKNRSEEGSSPKIEDLVKMLVGKYDGKSENDLLKAIFKEAEKGRKNGTLKDEDIDRFASILAPLVDPSKRKKLYEVCEKLKKQK